MTLPGKTVHRLLSMVVMSLYYTIVTLPGNTVQRLLSMVVMSSSLLSKLPNFISISTCVLDRAVPCGADRRTRSADRSLSLTG